jgi:hypothetical protein
MRTLPDEIERPLKIAGNQVDRSVDQALEVITAEVLPAARRHARLLAGLALGMLAAAGLVAIVQRRRRRRSLADRLQSALPDSVRDLPIELAQHLKRPVRMVRARVQ